MSYFNATKIEDDSGNIAALHLTTDGDYHLGTSIQQDVQADPNNSSIVDLDAAATFTGTATSTLGVVGLQWSLKTSQNCTVTIEQSPNGTNWDISDTWEYYYAKGGSGGTVQALNSYWRILVKNNGLIATSGFRLQAILCPIAEPLPRKLSPYGNLQVVASLRGDENIDRHAWINPTSELNVSPVYRLVGTAFEGVGIDGNFWSTAITNAGSVVQTGGVITLNTNTTAGGTAKLISVRRGRFVAGSANLFSGALKSSTGVSSNLRRVGAYDTNNGVFYQLDGTTFSIGTRKATSDTLVSSGSFNGNLGSTYAPPDDTFVKLDVEFTPLVAFFYINGKLLHKVTGGNYSDTMTLPITVENNNTTIDTSSTFIAVGLYIARLGELITNPIYKHITAATTTVCKVGAGVLHRVIINDPTIGTTLYMYDDATGAGTTIGLLNFASKATSPVSIEYGVPFSNGLTIITTGTWDATIVYE